jgi:hypothetical protein
MSAWAAVAEETRRPAECWCCGLALDSDPVVRLGRHPEVTLCTRCARWLAKRADEVEDSERSGLAVTARNALRRGRQAVIQRGWHNRPVVGRMLRRLGRWLP